MLTTGAFSIISKSLWFVCRHSFTTISIFLLSQFPNRAAFGFACHHSFKYYYFYWICVFLKHRKWDVVLSLLYFLLNRHVFCGMVYHFKFLFEWREWNTVSGIEISNHCFLNIPISKLLICPFPKLSKSNQSREFLKSAILLFMFVFCRSFQIGLHLDLSIITISYYLFCWICVLPK